VAREFPLSGSFEIRVDWSQVSFSLSSSTPPLKAPLSKIAFVSSTPIAHGRSFVAGPRPRKVCSVRDPQGDRIFVVSVWGKVVTAE
jgi:hypothetical protein